MFFSRVSQTQSWVTPLGEHFSFCPSTTQLIQRINSSSSFDYLNQLFWNTGNTTLKKSLFVQFKTAEFTKPLHSARETTQWQVGSVLRECQRSEQSVSCPWCWNYVTQEKGAQPWSAHNHTTVHPTGLAYNVQLYSIHKQHNVMRHNYTTPWECDITNNSNTHEALLIYLPAYTTLSGSQLWLMLPLLPKGLLALPY